MAKGSLLRALAAEGGKPTVAHLWSSQEKPAQRWLDALWYHPLSSAPAPASACQVSFVPASS